MVVVLERVGHGKAQVARAARQQKQFRERGVEVVASTPEQFGELLRTEIPKWTKVVQDAGVTIE